MKIKITQLKNFVKDVDSLIKKKALLDEDFCAFKKMLSERPEWGDVISGTGGIRKIRLKSSSKGKSGGFRICYFYSIERAEIFLVCIYGKNKQESLSAADKKELKVLVEIFKGRMKK